MSATIYNEHTQETSVSKARMDSIAAMSSSSRAITKITQDYLDQYDSDKHPSPEQVENDLLKQIRRVVLLHNKCAESGEEWETPKSLPWYTIVDILLKFHAKSVDNVGNKVSDNVRIRTIIYSYNSTICSNDVQEITKRVKDMAELDSAVNGMSEKDALVNEFKQYVLGRARTRCLPTTLLFIMYKRWHQKNHSDQQPYGQNQFFDAMKRLINPAADAWYYADVQERIKDRFDWHDPILKEFQCAEWVAKHKEDKFARGLFRLEN